MRFSLLCTLILLTSAALAVTLPVVNGDFSAVPITCGGGYAYQAFGGDCTGPIVPQQDFNGTPGFGWTLIPFAGNGLTGPGTGFNPPNNISFVAAAFLQGSNGSLSQSVPGFVSAGTYALTFFLGSRFANGDFDGNQTIEALIDGNIIGMWPLVSFTPFARESANFTVSTGGSHVLEFLGTNAGDHTAFLTDIVITPVPEPSTLVTLTLGLLGGLSAFKRHFF